ncbi:hypothetical protein ACLQ2R_34410 [Streptosporangium sp. DT93]|uniref:hypothetical protein n=1 Tax=Streptosporangium sp. DT93 TaxID=3393428 RepID=UPI003CF260A0
MWDLRHHHHPHPFDGEGPDHTANTITLKPEFLAEVNDGPVTLTFHFWGGAQITYRITRSGTTVTGTTRAGGRAGQWGVPRVHLTKGESVQSPDEISGRRPNIPVFPGEFGVLDVAAIWGTTLFNHRESREK